MHHHTLHYYYIVQETKVLIIPTHTGKILKTFIAVSLCLVISVSNVCSKLFHELGHLVAPGLTAPESYGTVSLGQNLPLGGKVHLGIQQISASSSPFIFISFKCKK